jgi:hypothetical protein
MRSGRTTSASVAIASSRRADAISSSKTSSFAAMKNQEDAPPCSTCGSIMVRSGSCYKCANWHDERLRVISRLAVGARELM